jgi:cytochrome P450
MNLICSLFLGFLIPKGWKVLVWLRAIHMDHEFHLNPKEFNPARWNVSQCHV